MKKRVGVIMGGTSGEREVSLRSGAAVAGALLARGQVVSTRARDGASHGDHQSLAQHLDEVGIVAASHKRRELWRVVGWWDHCELHVRV